MGCVGACWGALGCGELRDEAGAAGTGVGVGAETGAGVGAVCASGRGVDWVCSYGRVSKQRFIGWGKVLQLELL